MAKQQKRRKRRAESTNRSQARVSTASRRSIWALILTALVCVGIAGLFGLKSLSNPEAELQGNEPLPGLTAEWANREGVQQAQAVAKMPAAGEKDSSQSAAEASPKYTEDKLEQETMAVLKRLVKDFPGSADPLGLMGDVYVELGKTAEAMKCWESCAKLQPRRASSHERMAHTAVERGEFERAVAIAFRALKIDPVMPGIYSQLGRALKGLAKPRESVAALEKAVKISPNLAENHHLLGQAYQQLQQHERAKQSFIKALQINPNYTEACYGMASACARLGQTDEAAKYRKVFMDMKARDFQSLPDERDYVLHQSLLMKSRHRAAKVRTNAGIMYYERGQHRTAESHWLRAAELDPANTGCREELMTIHQQNGRNREALQICNQLRQLAPKNAQYHMCAATLLTRMNRIEDALLAVKRAIALEPQNASFRRIYAQIQERQ
jgi:tetratricopeptide (TPR) repeat protein